MTLTFEAIEYKRKYRDDILSLMFYSRHTHTHLDWYKAGTWLDLDNKWVVLAFKRDELVGVLGLSDGLNRAVWIRLAIIAQGYDPTAVLNFLWEQARPILKQDGITQTALLVINPWIAEHLPSLGFEYRENVVTMHRAPLALPPKPITPVTIRNGYLEDLQAISMIDHAAFSPPWQMNPVDLRASQRQAASCRVALYDNAIIGYEIATRHHTAGHLARLAVNPEYQGKRVGQLLLHDLLTRFTKRGVKGMTVNTQQSNIRSQHLYERFGFIRNGFDLPVWITQL